MELNCRESSFGSATVLSLDGEIDLATIPGLYDALLRSVTAAEDGTVVVDLDGVYVCDDAGLGVLLGAAGRIRQAGGELRVVCSAGRLRDRLGHTGFDRAIGVTSTLADALTTAR